MSPDHDETAEDADEGADDVEDDPGGDVGEDGEAGHDDQHHQHHAVHRAPDHPAQHHHVLLLPENTHYDAGVKQSCFNKVSRSQCMFYSAQRRPLLGRHFVEKTLC